LFKWITTPTINRKKRYITACELHIDAFGH